MYDLPQNWRSPKAIVVLCTAITSLGLGVVGSLSFGWHLITSIPRTEANTADIKREIGGLTQDHTTFRETLTPKLDEGNRLECVQCYIAAKGDPEFTALCACDASK